VPAFRSTRYFAQHVRPERSAEWIDALLGCAKPGCRLIEQGSAPVSVHRALAHARRAMREPEQILPALQQLHVSLRDACNAASEAPP
jgi:hypothetical protein